MYRKSYTNERDVDSSCGLGRLCEVVWLALCWLPIGELPLWARCQIPMGEKKMKLLLVLIPFFGLMARAVAANDPPVVSRVDLHRYSGLWYEIAHSPNFFQGGCERSTAEYGVLPDGGVSVLNTCYADGKAPRVIKGVATAPDRLQPAKLKVDFGFLFKGDYWISYLDPDYQWAVVSGPGKRSNFLLARSAPMNATLLNGILARLRADGFDVSNLIYDRY